MSDNARQRLLAYIDSVIAIDRRRAMIRCALLAVIILLVGTVSFVALDMLFYIGSRFVFYYRVFLLAAVALSVAIFIASRISRTPARPAVARHMESVEPAADSLVTTVEVGAAEIERYGFSKALYDITVARAEARFLEADPARFVECSLAGRMIVVILVLSLTLGLLAFAGGGRSFARFWPELVALVTPKALEIVSDEKDFTAFIGEETELRFRFARRERLELVVHYTTDREKSRFHDFPDPRESRGADLAVVRLAPPAETIENGLYIYRHKLAGAGGNFYYCARSEDSASKSRTHFVAMKRRPDITRTNATYEFPAYTKIAPMMEENVTDINGLFGTTVQIVARANARVRSAKLSFEKDGSSWPMDISKDGTACSAKIKLEAKDGYRITIEDADGNRNREIPFRQINVYPDKMPAVEIVEPKGELTAPAERKIVVTAKASDDFGISRMALVHYVREGEEHSSEISLHERGLAEVIAKAELDFTDVTVRQGESLYYCVEAWDNDAVSGPKVTRSAVNRIVFPTQYDEAMAIEALQGSIEARLEKVAAEQKAITEKVAEMSEMAKQKTMSEYEIRKNMENLARRQENLAKEAQEIDRDLKDVIKKMENNIYIKPETLAKITEIQETIQRVLNEDMKRAIEAMNKKAEQTKLSVDDVKRFSSEFDERKLMEKFERLKELFAKAEKEQKFQTFMKELEMILQKQEFVMENTEKAGQDSKDLNSELSAEQKAITENFKKAEADFEKNLPDMSEISEEVADAAKDASKGLKSDMVGEKMKKAGDSLASNDPKSAFEKQKEIADSLRRHADELKKAFEKFKEKNKEDIRAAVISMLEKTTAMARLMDEVKAGFEEAVASPHARGGGDPDAPMRQVGAGASAHAGGGEGYVEALDSIGEKCLEISDASRSIVGSMMEVSKKSMLVDSNHVAMAGAVMRLLNSMKPHIAEHEAVAASNLAAQARGALNHVNVALLDILDIISSAKSGSNMDQLMEMLKKQAEAQARLNAKTAKMAGQEGQGMPQISPEGYKMLAFEQQMIRRSVERIMDGLEPNSEAARKLKEMRNEMIGLESEYLRKQVGSKIQTRQKLLQERLLEMQRALFKEKETTERKADAAKKYDAAAPKNAIAVQDAEKVKKMGLELDEAVRGEKYPKIYERIIELYIEAIQKF